ncbi:MAG: DUF4116 domain-containing protein, partial [Candidatus Pacebacteria bacterium]|nr:DUF4116 domain-containing protein [Candidatus Paceibacterota bacterium]
MINNEDWMNKIWEWADYYEIGDGEIPRTEKELKSMECLYISEDINIRNRFDLPPEFVNLTNIVDVRLSGLKLTKVPRVLYQMVNITKLDLSLNNIKTIIKEIENLVHLKELNLSANNISKISKNIGKLLLLKDLQLEINKLQELPAEINLLTQLEEISFGGNDISSYPEVLDNSKIQKWILKIWRWKIEENIWGEASERSVWWLKHYRRYLYDTEGIPLNSKKIRENRHNIYIKNDKREFLYDFFPVELLKLKFDFITIYNCPYFTKIPNLFFNLDISKLNLANNNISKIPEEIGNLLSLSKLDLSGNCIEELPSTIYNLNNLNELNVGNNKIKVLPPLQCIELKSLRYLNNKDPSLEYKELVLEAVSKNGLELKYVSEELKADKEVVLEAVKNDADALAYASKEFKSDKEFILEAVKN